MKRIAFVFALFFTNSLVHAEGYETFTFKPRSIPRTSGLRKESPGGTKAFLYADCFFSLCTEDGISTTYSYRRVVHGKGGRTTTASVRQVFVSPQATIKRENSELILTTSGGRKFKLGDLKLDLVFHKPIPWEWEIAQGVSMSLSRVSNEPKDYVNPTLTLTVDKLLEKR